MRNCLTELPLKSKYNDCGFPSTSITELRIFTASCLKFKIVVVKTLKTMYNLFNALYFIQVGEKDREGHEK